MTAPKAFGWGAEARNRYFSLRALWELCNCVQGSEDAPSQTAARRCESTRQISLKVAPKAPKKSDKECSPGSDFQSCALKNPSAPRWPRCARAGHHNPRDARQGSRFPWSHVVFLRCFGGLKQDLGILAFWTLGMVAKVLTRARRGLAEQQNSKTT